MKKRTGMKANESVWHPVGKSQNDLQSLEDKCANRLIDYYVNVVKRELHDIRGYIAKAKNQREKSFYEDNYDYRLGVYAEALDISEQELEHQIGVRHEELQDK